MPNVVLLRPDEAMARRYIDNHFRDVREASFATMRKVAHQALNDLIKGNLPAANAGIKALGYEGARDLRAKLMELGFKLE